MSNNNIKAKLVSCPVCRHDAITLSFNKEKCYCMLCNYKGKYGPIQEQIEIKKAKILLCLNNMGLHNMQTVLDFIEAQCDEENDDEPWNSEKEDDLVDRVKKWLHFSRANNFSASDIVEIFDIDLDTAEQIIDMLQSEKIVHEDPTPEDLFRE